MQSNNFGIGLPVATKNKNYWHLKKPLLANKALKPNPEQIRTAKERFLEFLRIRYTSPLFRLRGREDVLKQLKFHNLGKDQVHKFHAVKSAMKPRSQSFCGFFPCSWMA